MKSSGTVRSGSARQSCLRYTCSDTGAAASHTCTTCLASTIALSARTFIRCIIRTRSLSTERGFSGLPAFLLPERRPYDNVRTDLKVPQEDEFALAVACLRSPYLAG